MARSAKGAPMSADARWRHVKVVVGAASPLAWGVPC